MNTLDSTIGNTPLAKIQRMADRGIGDIYLKQDNKEEARKSYITALKLYKGQGDIRKVIQNKIDSIGK